jgi:hypothetical protein
MATAIGVLTWFDSLVGTLAALFGPFVLIGLALILAGVLGVMGWRARKKGTRNG